MHVFVYLLGPDSVSACFSRFRQVSQVPPSHFSEKLIRIFALLVRDNIIILKSCLVSEQEILELEKKFWCLVGNSSSGRIDLEIITSMVSPPLPASMALGFFRALDENQDGHVDFKELACGVSAACRGPEMERQKCNNDLYIRYLNKYMYIAVCFKMFDLDGDSQLCESELIQMLENMVEIVDQIRADGGSIRKEECKTIILDLLQGQGNSKTETRKHLTMEEFLVWTVDNVHAREISHIIVQLCHVGLGLRPSSRMEEGNIVKGWLNREEKAGLKSGQVWYLVPMYWWTHWQNYVETLETSSNESNGSSNGNESPSIPRKLVSETARPGIIDTACLIQSPHYRGITVLTGEGGKLKNSDKLQRGRDFELLPEQLWKFLVQLYGSSVPLPRQIIKNKNGSIELELNPIFTRILKHKTITRQPNVPSPAGGYSAAALQAGVGASSYHSFNGVVSGMGMGPPSVTRRYHAYQATFSKRTAIGQIHEFLSSRLNVKHEDLRLWLYRGDESSMIMMDSESSTLEEIGCVDDDAILAEIRSQDGTWPEEISSLCRDQKTGIESQPLTPGVTGLNNLGNTCYMNAALQVRNKDIYVYVIKNIFGRG